MVAKVPVQLTGYQMLSDSFSMLINLSPTASPRVRGCSAWMVRMMEMKPTEHLWTPDCDVPTLGSFSWV